jgi:hypothetical protein
MAAIAAHSSINRTVHLSNIIRAQYAPGRIALPVSGGVYARLKHVQGVPAQTGDGGFSISKLRMIDILVDHLVQLKGRSGETQLDFRNQASASMAASDDMDALIAQYAAEVASKLRAAEAISPSVTSGLAQPGMLFSLVA